MDNFMDKLAQRLTAQEMIKANSAADAAELERLQKQLAQYDACLQEMRKLSLNNVETTDKITALLNESISKIQSYESNQADILNGLTDKANEFVDKANDFVHKENVKVYRNVQAVVVDELKNQTEGLTKHNRELYTKMKSVKVLIFIAIGLGLVNIALTLLSVFGII